MKTFPDYLQHDVMDCGPTCLRMVSAFYGKLYSLERLREKSFITREGVSMLGISEAAEKIGLRSICVQVGYNMLQEAPLPCIVHWNQQHFVVVYRVTDKQVWVADPGTGKLKYTREEFCRCWFSTKNGGEETGVALLLEPTPEFYSAPDEEETTNHTGFRFLFSYLRPYKHLMGQLILGLFLGSMIQLMLPFLTQSIVDFGINNQNLGFIYLVLIAQLMLTFSSSAVEFIRGWILLHLGTRINIALISDFLVKLMKLPMGYFDTKMTGDILQRINDHTRIQNFLTGSSLSVIFSTFNIVIFGIVLLIYSSMIFFIFMGGSALYMSYVWLFMKKRAELDHKRFAQQSANQSTVVQLVNGMQEIKLSACEQQKRWEWERIQARLFKVNIKSLALRQYQDSGAVLINQTKNILITGLVASLVVQGEMTLGMMLSVQYIIGQLNSPINDLITFARDMQDARLSMNRLSEVRDKPDEEDPAKELIREIPKEKDLRIENLGFKYDPLSEYPTLDNISLKIQTGKQTAIVGMSGSGKTTLVKLLLGFYPPASGQILLGDIPIENYSIREWRKQCGVVVQDGFIFSDSIAGNIAPGVEYINKEKLRHAAEVANIHGFIEELPLGTLCLGILTSIAILYKEQFNEHFLERICHLGQAVNCNKVLHSKGANIAGTSLGELSLLYFTVLFLFSAIQSQDFYGIAVICNVAAVCFTIYSIIYQSFIIRKGCILCMLVNLIIWSNAAILCITANGVIENFSIISTLTFAAIGCICLIIGIAFSIYRKEYKEKNLLRARQSTLLSSITFQKLLELQPSINGTIPPDLTINNHLSGKNHLLIIT